MMTRLFGSFVIGENDSNFTILTKQKTVLRTKIVNNERISDNHALPEDGEK